jgi:molybdopterin molybdotransferase
MISVYEAFQLVLSQTISLQKKQIDIQDSIGQILGETIVADRDLPPFDRVAMDGIAVRFETWQQGKTSFVVEGIQPAGAPMKALQHPEHALEVMTGAMLPEGADTVIPYEEISIQDSIATAHIAKLEKGRNIHQQGSDAKSNTILLNPGVCISPAEIALLASVGKRTVDVMQMPRAAVISSGDELVEIDAKPLPHQIRRTNSYALMAAMKQLQWDSSSYYLPDNKNIIEERLSEIFSKHDVIIISGGVSKGKFDYIPQALENLGIKKLFHFVSQRPGKPFWFGVNGEGKVVFSLPGNPVSTMLCFYKYIMPWMKKCRGEASNEIEAILAEDFKFEPVLTYFVQVKTSMVKGSLFANPIPSGSGDFNNLKYVDGFLELPKERSVFKAGESFPLIAFRPIG